MRTIMSLSRSAGTSQVWIGAILGKTEAALGNWCNNFQDISNSRKVWFSEAIM